MWIILSFFEVSFEVQHCGSPFDWTRLYETLFCFGQRCQIPQHLFTDIHLHFMIPLVPNFIRGTAYNKYMDVSVLLYFVCIPAPVRKAANKVDVGEGMLRAAIIERYIYIYIHFVFVYQYICLFKDRTHFGSLQCDCRFRRILFSPGSSAMSSISSSVKVTTNAYRSALGKWIRILA